MPLECAGRMDADALAMPRSCLPHASLSITPHRLCSAISQPTVHAHPYPNTRLYAEALTTGPSAPRVPILRASLCDGGEGKQCTARWGFCGAEVLGFITPCCSPDDSCFVQSQFYSQCAPKATPPLWSSGTRLDCQNLTTAVPSRAPAPAQTGPRPILSKVSQPPVGKAPGSTEYDRVFVEQCLPSCAPDWQACGGRGFSGWYRRCCSPGYVCARRHGFFSQCRPRNRAAPSHWQGADVIECGVLPQRVDAAACCCPSVLLPQRVACHACRPGCEHQQPTCAARSAAERVQARHAAGTAPARAPPDCPVQCQALNGSHRCPPQRGWTSACTASQRMASTGKTNNATAQVYAVQSANQEHRGVSVHARSDACARQFGGVGAGCPGQHHSAAGGAASCMSKGGWVMCRGELCGGAGGGDAVGDGRGADP